MLRTELSHLFRKRSRTITLGAPQKLQPRLPADGYGERLLAD